jgi:hypothetical protein
MSTEVRQESVFAVLLHEAGDTVPFCSVEPDEADRVREMYALNGRPVEVKRFATRRYLELAEADPGRYPPLMAEPVKAFEHELG